MTAAVDWANLGVAAAFIVGAVAGAVGTIRITRHVLEYMKHREGDGGDTRSR